MLEKTRTVDWVTARENETYRQRFTAVQARLVLGGNGLSAGVQLTTFNENAKLATDLTPISEASHTDRRRHYQRVFSGQPQDELVSIWNQQFTGSYNTTVAGLSDEAKDRFVRVSGALLEGIGIDRFAGQMTTDLTQQIYDGFFEGPERKSRIDYFLRSTYGICGIDIATQDSITEEELQKVKEALPTIMWFASIFGRDTALVIRETIEGQIAFLSDKKKFADRVNTKEITQDGREVMRINNLRSEEEQILNFISGADHPSPTFPREPVTITEPADGVTDPTAGSTTGLLRPLGRSTHDSEPLEPEVEEITDLRDPVGQLNAILSRSGLPVKGFIATPDLLISFLKTFPLPNDAAFQGQTRYEWERGNIVVSGTIRVKVSVKTFTVPFRLTIANRLTFGLEIVRKKNDIEFPRGAGVFAKDEIRALNDTLADVNGLIAGQVNGRIPEQWEYTNLQLDSAQQKLRLEVKRKSVGRYPGLLRSGSTLHGFLDLAAPLLPQNYVMMLSTILQGLKTDVSPAAELETLNYIKQVAQKIQIKLVDPQQIGILTTMEQWIDREIDKLESH